MHSSNALGAYAVYQHLSTEKKTDFALYMAFAFNSIVAYKQFEACHLHLGETVDVYLAKLYKLAVQFGDITKRSLICTFIAGFPEQAKELLRDSSQIDELFILQILAHT